MELFAFVFDTENLNIYTNMLYNTTSLNIMKYYFKSKKLDLWPF